MTSGQTTVVRHLVFNFVMALPDIIRYILRDVLASTMTAKPDNCRGLITRVWFL